MKLRYLLVIVFGAVISQLLISVVAGIRGWPEILFAALGTIPGFWLARKAERRYESTDPLSEHCDRMVAGGTNVTGVTDNPRYPASVVMRSSRLRYCRDDS